MPRYAELNPSSQKRVDARAEQLFAQKAEEFEAKMAPVLLDSAPAKEIVQEMMAKVAKIVDAYAQHVGRNQNSVYEEEFRFGTGDKYYGAFLMTAANVRRVLTDTQHQPLRLQLKLIYNAVRNNNLAKWLKLAASELGGHHDHALHRIDDAHIQALPVAAGFAKDSGLKKVLKKNRGVRHAAEDAADHERKQVDIGHGVKRDVQHAQGMSAVMQTAPALAPTRIAKRYGANDGMPMDEQETVKRGDLADLTVAEIQQLKQNAGKPVGAVDDAKRGRFVAKGVRKIPWEQGREGIDVFPNSEVERQATAIHARLDAGISGSTDLMMHAAQNLGMTSADDLRKVRLALLGWMIANRDHSFYEIMTAAENYGPAFVRRDGSGVKPAYFYEAKDNFKPFDVKRLKTLLPEREFPGYFLSARNKDALAQALPPQLVNRSYGETGTALRQRGIPLDVLTHLSHEQDRDSFAFLEVLDEAVMAAPFDAAHTPVANRKNGWLRRTLRKSVAFLHLIHKYPVHADLMLSALIHHYHPAAETKEDQLMVQAAAALMPIANATNPNDAALRAALVARGAPDSLALDDRACPTFIVEQLLRLDGMVVASAFDTTGAPTAPAANARKLAELRSTRIWSDLCAFFGDDVQKESGTANLVLHGFIHHHHAGLERIAFQAIQPEKQDALQRGVPDLAMRNLAAGDWANLRALCDAIRVIAGGAGNDAAKRGQLQALDAAPAHAAIKGKLGTWFLAVVASVARTEHIDIDPDARMKLAGDLALVVRPGAVQPAALAANYPGWNTAAARQQLTANIAFHQNDAASPAKTALDNSAVALGNLSDRELYGIKTYTGFAGTGPWGRAIQNRDYTPGGHQMDKLGGSIEKIKAAVSGLNQLPVYTGGDVFSGTPWPAIDRNNDREVRRHLIDHYPLGKLISWVDFLSSSKRKEACYAYTKTPNYDLLWIIKDVRTGRDVQLASAKEDEEEVLFAPGWRLVVTKVENNLHNAASLYNGKLCVYLSEV
jgi:hypothetical protein